MPEIVPEVALIPKAPQTQVVLRKRKAEQAALIAKLPEVDFNAAEACRQLRIKYGAYVRWKRDDMEFRDALLEQEAKTCDALFESGLQRALGTHPSQTDDPSKPGKPHDASRRQYQEALDPRFAPKPRETKISGAIDHNHRALLNDMTPERKLEEARALLPADELAALDDAEDTEYSEVGDDYPEF